MNGGTQSTSPIRVLLAADQETLTPMYGAFMNKKEVQVAGLATSLGTLKDSLTQLAPEVAVIDMALLLDLGERGMLDFLVKLKPVAVLLYSPELASLQGKLQQIDRVRALLQKPVNFAQVVQKVRDVGTSERVAQASVAPGAQTLPTGKPRGSMYAPGLRVFAVTATKGGVGKTTVAANFAYALSMRGIRTLVIGFDTPDDLMVHFNLKKAPNSTAHFARPGREGFNASIQRIGSQEMLDVILSPNDLAVADEIAANRPDDIAGLVMEAFRHTPPYAAIVMDLPPRDDDWNIQPLLVANTVLMVMEPSVAGTIKTITQLDLITRRLKEHQRVSQESIYLVVNGFMDSDNMTAADIQAAIQERLEYSPPVIATIPFHEGVRPKQNLGQIPYGARGFEDFTRGIDALVEMFYKGVYGEGVKKRRTFRLPGIKVVR